MKGRNYPFLFVSDEFELYNKTHRLLLLAPLYISHLAAHNKPQYINEKVNS